MPNCSVKSCKHRTGNTNSLDVKFFRFPEDPELVEKWCTACGNENLNLKNARVCSIHFLSKYFLDTKHLCIPGQPPVVKLDKKIAIPTENLFQVTTQQKSTRKRKSNENCIQNELPTKKITNSSLEISPTSAQKQVGNSRIGVLGDIHNIFSPNRNEHDSIETDAARHKCSSSTVHISNDENQNQFDASDQVQARVIENDVSLRLQASIQANDTKENDLRQSAPTPFVEIDENNSTRNEDESFRLKSYIRQLETEVKKLNKKLQSQENTALKNVEKKVYEILSPIFTAGQIKKLLHPNQRRVKWCTEDIANAIALRSVSPKAYRYLRNKKHPYPALSTLRKWAAKVQINMASLGA